MFVSVLIKRERKKTKKGKKRKKRKRMVKKEDKKMLSDSNGGRSSCHILLGYLKGKEGLDGEKIKG